MATSSEEVIVDVTAGVTKGLLDKAEEWAKKFAQKFINKDVSFIENGELIQLAKDQKRKVEWTLFADYVKERKFRVLFQMGLALRKLEKDGKNFEELQRKIVNRYQHTGLHIAYFVQNGLFSKYLGILLARGISQQQLGAEIINLFNNIDTRALFIDNDNDLTQKAAEVVTKIRAHTPETFIISSAGSACNKCEEIKKMVMEQISSDYTPELYQAEEGDFRLMPCCDRSRRPPYHQFASRHMRAPLG